MKKIMLFAGVLFFTSAVQSQSTKKQSPKRGSAAKVSRDKAASRNAWLRPSNTASLNSTASYPAKSNTASPPALTISDPILTSLNARANGAAVKINKSGIVGMPKSAYGFANGHLALSSSGSTTSGTQTGSGLVGTGTSLGTFGSAGPALQVNGKSPYAGINMWGNAMNLNVLRPDSSSRIPHHKK